MDIPEAEFATRFVRFGGDHELRNDAALGQRLIHLLSKPSIFIKTALQLDKRTEHKSVFMKNYTVAVVAYLVCHTAVFVWSFVEETPVNSNLLYLPGEMGGIWTDMVLLFLF